MQNPSSKSTHASAVVSVSGWSSLVSHKMDSYAHKYLCNLPCYETVRPTQDLIQLAAVVEQPGHEAVGSLLR